MIPLLRFELVLEMVRLLLRGLGETHLPRSLLIVHHSILLLQLETGLSIRTEHEKIELY